MARNREELFGKLKKRKVFEDVAEMVRQLIDSGSLKPGDQLPPERELSERLGVSRTSVREAIRAMELTGEVETRVGVGGGTFIREISLNHALGVVQTLFRRTGQMVPDIVEVRLILETKTAFYAAERRTREDLEAIDSTLGAMRQDLDSGGIGLAPDKSFHLAVAKASENDFLYGLSQLVEDMIEQTRKTTLAISGVPREALYDHAAIADAIRNRESSQAETLMRAHLMKAYRISTGTDGAEL